MSKRNKDIALDLYTGDGWVNVPAVAALGCWCNIIIGKRQVGKTFGTLKYMLDENKYFLYMRRTVNELQAVAADPDLNPFNALQSVGYDIGILKAGKISYSIGDIEYTDEEGAAAMSGAGTVAVLLPGAYYFIRETKKPPVELFRKHGTAMALATDCNPGTSPLTSLLLTMNMAATLFRMTPNECLAGVTLNAARALGLPDRGAIAPGLRADLAVWDIAHPAELSYRIGFNPLHARIVGGEFV